MPKRIKSDLYAERKALPKDPLRQKRVYKKDDTREFFKLCRTLDSALFGKKARVGNGWTGGGRNSAARQNCVVKCRVGYDAVSHRRFLEEYMPQKNKNGVEAKPALFSDGIVDAAFLEAYANNMADKHFKFVISPESQQVDVEALVKTLVKRMEAASGRRFSWVAAVHRDTAHHHAHVLIDGTDKNGEDITFDKTFIRQTMREMCRDICTAMVGTRTRREIEAEKSRLHKRLRYCRLDDRLKIYERRLSAPNGRFASLVRAVDTPLKNRLDFLAELGLAEKSEGKSVYLLEAGWDETLKAIGRYNSFLRARSETAFAAASDMALYEARRGRVSGVVTRLYKMNDEDSWNHAILLENKESRQAWYVPLYYEPDAKLLGREITCETRKTQKGLLRPVIRAIGNAPAILRGEGSSPLPSLNGVN